MGRQDELKRKIRYVLLFFIVCLVISGLTAFPLRAEIDWLSSLLGIDTGVDPSTYSGLKGWIATVGAGLRDAYARYPFLAYGTDWLAFAHLVIAVAFVGPVREPVRNVWVVTFGMVASAGVIPLALIAGPLRGIPFYWRLIDCSFGVFGLITLWLARRYINELAATEQPGGASHGHQGV